MSSGSSSQRFTTRQYCFALRPRPRRMSHSLKSSKSVLTKKYYFSCNFAQRYGMPRARALTWIHNPLYRASSFEPPEHARSGAQFFCEDRSFKLFLGASRVDTKARVHPWLILPTTYPQPRSQDFFLGFARVQWTRPPCPPPRWTRISLSGSVLIYCVHVSTLDQIIEYSRQILGSDPGIRGRDQTKITKSIKPEKGWTRGHGKFSAISLTTRCRLLYSVSS